jgi:hypothetical protein
VSAANPRCELRILHGGDVSLCAPQGQPRLLYSPSKRTQQRMMEALLVQLRALKAAGASRLLTLHHKFTAFDAAGSGSGRDGAEVNTNAAGTTGDTSSFDCWLDTVKQRSADPARLMTLSAHQVLPPFAALHTYRHANCSL